MSEYLSGLTDTEIQNPTAGQELFFDGDFWVNYEHPELPIDFIGEGNVLGILNNEITGFTLTQYALKTDISSSISGETLLRESGDTSLSTAIQNIPQFDPSGLTASLSQEISDRISGDTSLSTAIQNIPQFDPSGLTASLSQEISDRISGDTSLSTAIAGNTPTYNTLLDPILTMPSSVGGIGAGTEVQDLSGKTFTNLFDDLLFPTVPPTLNAPYNSFSKRPSTSIYEVGDIISLLNFTSTFNRGSIYNGSTFQNYRSGLPNTYHYTGSGLPSSNPSTSLTDIEGVNNYEIVLGNQSWTSSVSYDSGVQPKDNKGNNSGSPLVAGTTSISTLTIEGVYPLYGTTFDITILSYQPLISMSTQVIPSMNGMTLVAESGNHKQQFEIPVAWTGFPISGIKNFDTNSNSWVYEGGSASTSLTYWTTSTTYYGSVEYTHYQYNGLDRGSMQVRIEL